MKNKKKQHEMTYKVRQAIKNFKKAAVELDEAFEDPRYMTWLSDKYPFGTNYNDLTDDIVVWCDDMVRDTAIRDIKKHEILMTHYELLETLQIINVIKRGEAEKGNIDRYHEVMAVESDMLYNTESDQTVSTTTVDTDQLEIIYDCVRLYIKFCTEKDEQQELVKARRILSRLAVS